MINQYLHKMHSRLFQEIERTISYIHTAIDNFINLFGEFIKMKVREFVKFMLMGWEDVIWNKPCT